MTRSLRPLPFPPLAGVLSVSLLGSCGFDCSAVRDLVLASLELASRHKALMSPPFELTHSPSSPTASSDDVEPH
jgi:hypothetical protein